MLTEVPDDDPGGYGFSDVTLARFRDGALEEPIPVTGSVGESAMRGACTSTGAISSD